MRTLTRVISSWEQDVPLGATEYWPSPQAWRPSKRLVVIISKVFKTCLALNSKNVWEHQRCPFRIRFWNLIFDLYYRTYLNLLFQSPIEPVYNSMSPDVCIGDHKPVFLSFTLRIEEEVPQNGNVNDVLTELDDTYKECIKGINNAMNEEGTSLQEWMIISFWRF